MANQQDDVFIHYHDPDEQETAEWLDAFHAVIENEGPERAHYLMERMADVARQKGINLPFSTETISLQETLLDAIVPGLLPLATVFSIYAYLKKGGNILKATLWILAIAIVLGGLGILV